MQTSAEEQGTTKWLAGYTTKCTIRCMSHCTMCCNTGELNEVLRWCEISTTKVHKKEHEHGFGCERLRMKHSLATLPTKHCQRCKA